MGNKALVAPAADPRPGTLLLILSLEIQQRIACFIAVESDKEKA